MRLRFSFIIFLSLGIVVYIYLLGGQKDSNPKTISYEVNPKDENIQFYWKNTEGELYSSFSELKGELAKEGKNLVFAMNGGMFNSDFSPTGLYIENSQELSALDLKTKGYGNFYMQPNGVFYLNKNKTAQICKTQAFKHSNDILYATQSGPLLVHEGTINSKFTKGSANIHIRNGVGILPNGNILFGISKQKINFYDFASFFKDLGCQNALYLDGFVSKMYLPTQNWKDLGGNFGVMVAVHKEPLN